MYIDKFLSLRQLNKEPGEGGTPPFLSIDDLDKAEEEASQNQPKIPDLKEEADKQENKEPDADPKEPEETLKPDPKAPAKKEKEDEDPKEDPKEPEATEDESIFWDDVDKLRGEALEVDFGDVDPESPEGALIYEKAVRLDELAKFEENLATNHPRAYALISHLLDGGKEEDFFKVAGDPVALPTEAELENDVEMQKDIITRNLKAKGNNDKQIDRIIKGSIQDDDLEEMAKDALKEEVKRSEDSLKAAQLQTENDRKFREEKIGEMKTYVDNVVATGKIDNIIVPEKDRVEFAKTFAGSIRIENGKFYSVTEISNDNIAKLMKEKFFSFKNGDLNGLIEKAAATQNTRRLRKTIDTSQAKPLAKGGKSESTLVTMAEMDD